MRDSFLTVWMLAFLHFVQGGMQMPTAITFDPNPPTAGQNFELRGAPNTRYTLDWDPSGTPSHVTTDANGKVTILAPQLATSLIATGGGASAATTITPTS
jgi:hypothetical protein